VSSFLVLVSKTLELGPRKTLFFGWGTKLASLLSTEKDIVRATKRTLFKKPV